MVMAEEGLVECILELRQELSLSTQKSQSLYDQNISSLALILRLQREKAELESSLEYEREERLRQMESLSGVISSQQNEIETFSRFNKLQSLWASLLLPSQSKEQLVSLSRMEEETLSWTMSILTSHYVNELSSPRPLNTKTIGILISPYIIQYTVEFLSYKLQGRSVKRVLLRTMKFLWCRNCFNKCGSSLFR